MIYRRENDLGGAGVERVLRSVDLSDDQRDLLLTLQSVASLQEMKDARGAPHSAQLVGLIAEIAEACERLGVGELAERVLVAHDCLSAGARRGRDGS